MSTRARRVYHKDPATAGGVVTLDEAESHHIGRVLRLQRGDAVCVFDGRGREWEGTLVEWSGSTARVRLAAERTDAVDPSLPVRLFQALCKPERMEWLIQKGTEIGLASIHPMLTARSEGPPPSPARMERWRRVALEACKQSGRRRLPEIADPVASLPGPTRANALGVVLDPDGGAAPLEEQLSVPRPLEVWIAIGPEGGFEQDEVETLVGAGWRAAGLGPRILRTETAGLVASALVLHRLGDLGSRGDG